MLRSLGLVAAAFLVATLAGCSSLSGLVAAKAPVAYASTERVFVATARTPASLSSVRAERSDKLAYAAFDVGIPPTHEIGRTPQQSSVRPVFNQDFVLSEGESYTSPRGFGDAVNSYAASHYGAPTEAFVFVHGFNTSFVDGIYQLAQIGNDIKSPASMVLFSWPSNDRMTDYLHDVDSVAFARDGLEQLLNELAASGVKRITLVGYSMGAALVVETLRQMKLVGSTGFFSKLSGVVLLSPDMDIDVFRVDAERMGGLPQPFVIYSAPRDPALRVLSTYLTAQKPRLGSLPDPSALSGLDLVYVDVSNVPHYRQEGHLPVATSPNMIAQINALPRADLMAYARIAAAGGVPGAAVNRYGRLTYVTLPRPGR